MTDECNVVPLEGPTCVTESSGTYRFGCRPQKLPRPTTYNLRPGVRIPIGVKLGRLELLKANRPG